MRSFVLFGALAASLALGGWTLARPTPSQQDTARAVPSAPRVSGDRKTERAASTAGAGTIGGLPNVVEFARAADVVLVGTATAVQDAGTSRIPVNGQLVDVYAKVALVSPIRYLKGDAGPVVQTVFYTTKDVEIESQGIPQGKTGLLFLKAIDKGQYTAVSMRYPVLPALPSARLSGATDDERVIEEIYQAATSPALDLPTRQAVMQLLGTVVRREPIPAALDAARRIAADTSSPLRFSAAAVLLERDDVSVLDSVADVLLTPPADMDPNVIRWLGVALSDGVKDKTAIPTLARLLSAPNVEVREGASNALRHTQATEAIEPLARIALEDKEWIVRYNAVIGLAEITGLYEGATSLGNYQSNEQKYLDYWRAWRDVNLR